jgi:hypothetical protein
MNLAAIVTVCLLGQVTYSVDDSLNQWENHLLEARWVLMDRVTDEPRVFLTFKCFTPDHRIFSLYLYDQWEGDAYRTVRCWTGTYKMESREKKDKTVVEKIVRLKCEQYWIPVDSEKPSRIRRWMSDGWMSDQGFTRWLTEPDSRHWTENLDFLHWTEEVDFKPFYAEFKLTPPSPKTEADVPSDCIHFQLRSDDVKKVGWWIIGNDYLMTPVKKWLRSTTATGY